MAHSKLLLGGARSGKSKYALTLAEHQSDSPIFVATAERSDAEMQARIRRHRAERGPSWATVECPVELVETLDKLAPNATIVVDCLTLWLSNLMHYEIDVGSEIERLSNYLTESGQSLILVSNEVGMGLVPQTELGRSFRDWQGRLNQDVAAVVNEAFFLAAGLPLRLK